MGEGEWNAIWCLKKKKKMKWYCLSVHFSYSIVLYFTWCWITIWIRLCGKAVTPSLPVCITDLESLEWWRVWYQSTFSDREWRHRTTEEIPMWYRTVLCNDIQAISKQASFWTGNRMLYLSKYMYSYTISWVYPAIDIYHYCITTNSF